MEKKIAVIGLKGLPAFGGAATVGENIIEKLKEDFDFTVYSISSHTDLRTGDLNGYKQIVLKKISLNKLNSLLYYVRSAFRVLFTKVDIVHLHHTSALFLIPLLKLKAKVLVTTHGAHINFKERKWKKFEKYFMIQLKYFLNKADYITCVSKVEKKWLKTNFNILAKFIPNGIDIYEKSLNKSNIPNEPYLFFAAGRIMETKGCHTFLEALVEIKYKGLVLIAGKMGQVKKYDAIIKDLSSNLNVLYLGLIREKNVLMNYIKGAELFIFPSLQEAMSMMLLEAASTGTKIICSDIIENKDVFSNEHLVFFKAGNPNDLAEKIRFAIKNKKLLSQKSTACIKYLKKQYSWTNISNSYRIIYNELF